MRKLFHFSSQARWTVIYEFVDISRQDVFNINDGRFHIAIEMFLCLFCLQYLGASTSLPDLHNLCTWNYVELYNKENYYEIWYMRNSFVTYLSRPFRSQINILYCDSQTWNYELFTHKIRKSPYLEKKTGLWI